jgi:GR25 family glycosyltransferase involved in LPS biosynthesis
MIPVIYINLPSRGDRRKSCDRQLQEQGYPTDEIYRYIAKDARTYKLDAEEWNLFEGASFMASENRKSIVCNWLSHLSVWNYVKDYRFSYMVVLEDNMILQPEFRTHLEILLPNLPSDAEIVWLGVPSDNQEVSLSRVDPAIVPSSVGYILTQKGARELLDATEKGITTDMVKYLNDYLKAKNISYCSSVPLVTRRDNFYQ